MFDGATVFVVDDDPAVLRSLVTLLGVVFPQVEGYGSAAAFLEAYHPECPGCLVLDVAMPGMNGLQLQNRLIEAGMDLPVVFVSGHANVPLAVDAMQAGAVDFLEKPFREEELWKSVRRGLHRDWQNRHRKASQHRIEKRLARLTAGEREVLKLLLEGKCNKEMAARLRLSIRTIEDRRARLMRKMEADSLAELVQMAMSVSEGVRPFHQQAPVAIAASGEPAA